MVLLYFMDGVKYDMMKKHMPFLTSVNSMPLQSDFGYSCACHATMYTSRYIDEHNTWFIWKKGDNSPYKWINYIPGLKYINFLPLKLVLGKLTRKFSRNSSYSGVSCLVNLPLKYWPLFEPCDNVMWNDPKWKSDIPNMFTILKDKSIRHDVVALHRGTKADDAFLEERTVDYKNDDFVYYFIGYTDNIMHAYGENGKEAQQYLSKVDSFIKETYEKAKKYHDDVTLIAYSDHGHIDLEEPYININDYFKPEGLNVNRYIHLIESNYARFWFRNEQERNEVEKVIKKMTDSGLGFVLDKDYQEKYHLCVNPKEHGELIFYLAAPHEFTNTIWGFGHSVKSGHGFEPTLPKHYGIFCSDKPLAADRDFAYLTDVLPSVMQQLNIDRTDYVLRGKNIVNTKKAN
ncbi:MAG: alkaline phosphatase family protein [Acutalibacteraceae bacterium]